jgi:membrane protein DedA with SNARE-associated domain
VDADDFTKSADWLKRHGRGAVFFGRLVPLMRSLISLPAGATRMPFGRFALFTLAGTLLWNMLLVGAGYALGTLYHVVERYTEYLDIVIYVGVGLVVGWLVVRRVMRRRASRNQPDAES